MGRSRMTIPKVTLLPLAICLLLSKPSPGHFLVETKDNNTLQTTTTTTTTLSKPKQTKPSPGHFLVETKDNNKNDYNDNNDYVNYNDYGELVCKDEDGNSRVIGEPWICKWRGKCNTCRCDEGNNRVKITHFAREGGC